MCEAAKIEGNFTNHSLRASEATSLFQAEAPEKVIQEFTGHRSVEALRQYEKIANQQKQATCIVLTVTSSTSYSGELEKLTYSHVTKSLFPNYNTHFRCQLFHLKLATQEQLMLL